VPPTPLHQRSLAARLRARHALGRSPGLNRLFDYLAQCARAGMRPKEFEVAPVLQAAVRRWPVQPASWCCWW